MDFLGAVNRLFRITRIIKGDDDALTNFTTTQHAANLELAKIAIQDELGDLVADSLIPYEDASSTLTSVSGTRVYTLASDFIRFYGNNPFLYDEENNRAIPRYRGGEDRLRHEILDYKTQSGDPSLWYPVEGTSKQIGLFQVPDDANAGKVYSYDYEKDVSVDLYTDTLPFHTETEAQAFVGASVRRFQFMHDGLNLEDLPRDPLHTNAKARLAQLMRMYNPRKRYGNKYG